MRFDLIDLRLFDAVARSGSISKGAELVHLALASASARISGMEAVLGVALLERGRRGVIPTAAGRALLVHARSITDGVERMRGDLRLFSSGFKGEIRMLSNTAALVDIVPRALKVFCPPIPGSRSGSRSGRAPRSPPRWPMARRSSAWWPLPPTWAASRRGRWQSTG